MSPRHLLLSRRSVQEQHCRHCQQPPSKESPAHGHRLLNNTATTTYTFTPTAGQCATTNTLTITVNPNVTPTFDPAGPYCSGATIPDLPTTSLNNITGTWSPAINNTATTTYLFTPDAGQCGTTATINIVITTMSHRHLILSRRSVRVRHCHHCQQHPSKESQVHGHRR